MRTVSEKSNWLCLVTKLYGDAFSILQKISNEGFQPFEVAPLGKKGFLFAELSESLADSLEKSFPKDFAQKTVHFQILKNIDSRVINSYLGLESSQVKKFILFESFSFLGEALHRAQQALDLGFEVVDLRMIRSHDPVTHVLLTGYDIEKVKKFMGPDSVLIENPGHNLKNYFDILV